MCPKDAIVLAPLAVVAKWIGKYAANMPQACPPGFVARRNKNKKGSLWKQ